jgi:hypothetical protein
MPAFSPTTAPVGTAVTECAGGRDQRLKAPVPGAGAPGALVAALSSEGRSLVSIAEVLNARGKGKSCLASRKACRREELMSAVAVVGAGQALRIPGERQMTLNPADLHYRGERAARAVPPRGWRTVEWIKPWRPKAMGARRAAAPLQVLGART